MSHHWRLWRHSAWESVHSSKPLVPVPASSLSQCLKRRGAQLVMGDWAVKRPRGGRPITWRWGIFLFFTIETVHSGVFFVIFWTPSGVTGGPPRVTPYRGCNTLMKVRIFCGWILQRVLENGHIRAAVARVLTARRRLVLRDSSLASTWQVQAPAVSWLLLRRDGVSGAADADGIV